VELALLMLLRGKTTGLPVKSSSQSMVFSYTILPGPRIFIVDVAYGYIDAKQAGLEFCGSVLVHAELPERTLKVAYTDNLSYKIFVFSPRGHHDTVTFSLLPITRRTAHIPKARTLHDGAGSEPKHPLV